MNYKWWNRLNTARAWMFGAALVIVGTAWLVRHQILPVAGQDTRAFLYV
jgi:hypothetical protein